MALPIQPPDIVNFKKKLHLLCKEYNINQLVAILEHGNTYTAVIQFKRSEQKKNEIYNEIHKQFLDILEEIENDQRKNN